MEVVSVAHSELAPWLHAEAAVEQWPQPLAGRAQESWTSLAHSSHSPASIKGLSEQLYTLSRLTSCGEEF